MANKMFLAVYERPPSWGSGSIQIALIQARDEEEAKEKAVATKEASDTHARQRVQVAGVGEFIEVMSIKDTQDYS